MKQDPLPTAASVAGCTAFGALCLALISAPYLIGTLAAVLAVAAGLIAIWLRVTE
jgi:hypothetical protein